MKVVDLSVLKVDAKISGLYQAIMKEYLLRVFLIIVALQCKATKNQGRYHIVNLYNRLIRGSLK